MSEQLPIKCILYSSGRIVCDIGCVFIFSLQVLRSSMIELINQDYADFVQLSTVLVGVDQGILAIREPIEGFSAEVAAARAELASCLDRWVTFRAANKPSAKFSQSPRRRLLLEPSPR